MTSPRKAQAARRLARRGPCRYLATVPKGSLSTCGEGNWLVQLAAPDTRRQLVMGPHRRGSLLIAIGDVSFVYQKDNHSFGCLVMFSHVAAY